MCCNSLLEFVEENGIVVDADEQSVSYEDGTLTIIVNYGSEDNYCSNLKEALEYLQAMVPGELEGDFEDDSIDLDEYEEDDSINLDE